MAVFAALLSSCGGGSGSVGGAGGRRGDGSAGAGGAPAQCAPDGGLVPEPAPRQVALDGGVPLAQLSYALAVARCDYWSRCFGLATYVDNECVDTLANGGVWFSQTCALNAHGTLCASIGMYRQVPTPALLQAAAAGTVHYDPQQEGRCVAALMAEDCVGGQLVETIPACAGVFTCAATPDAGPSDAGPSDAGPSDGGPSDGGACAVIPTPEPFVACTTNHDCAGLSSDGYQGPFCAHGFCADSPCGIFEFSCNAFVQAGQPCDSNASSILDVEEPTATGTCAPSLTCDFTDSDGGRGTCVVTRDVGGACTDPSFCKPGLACVCGTCQIPPSSGPCADGLCEVGVAYCDLGTNLCHPVRGANAACLDAAGSCGPGLNCDPVMGTCQPNPNDY